jgi:hypothetical protein
MSVPKSKQILSKATFKDELKFLRKDVIAWCKKQSKKSREFALKDLYNLATDAERYGCRANNHYFNKPEDAEIRAKYFKQSIQSAYLFAEEATLISECFEIKKTRMHRWMHFTNSAIRQMKALMRSDAARAKDMKKKLAQEETTP